MRTSTTLPKRLFTEHHVRVATERLKELNWMTGGTSIRSDEGR